MTTAASRLPEFSSSHPPAMTGGQPSRPRIGITVGDVAGVGPEVIVRALADPRVRAMLVPVLIGPPQVFRRAAALVKTDLTLQDVTAVGQVGQTGNSGTIACFDPTGDAADDIRAGTVDPRAGRIAYFALRAAAEAALAGELDAIVTAPLNKFSLHQAGYDFPGHTEILADASGVSEYAMMLYVPPGGPAKGSCGLGVAHVTLHTAIASVPGLLTEPAILATIRLLDSFLQQVGCAHPRLGVCALNPHAGEQGLFGDEEQRVITPAVDRARAEHMDARGPFPADTLLARALAGEFDGVAAMYHDQGHIAIKLVAFHSAVNVTLGLPIIRTSPTQGTAFDIAWKGIANPNGMIEALLVAARLAAARSRPLAA